MHIEIGAFEAKAKLPELLRGVLMGNRYTITLRGKPVADLVPIEDDSCTEAHAEAAVDQMRQLMLDAEPVSKVNIKALIDEGRA